MHAIAFGFWAMIGALLSIVALAVAAGLIGLLLSSWVNKAAVFWGALFAILVVVGAALSH